MSISANVVQLSSYKCMRLGIIFKKSKLCNAELDAISVVILVNGAARLRVVRWWQDEMLSVCRYVNLSRPSSAVTDLLITFMM